MQSTAITITRSQKLPIDRIEKIDAEIEGIVTSFNRKYNEMIQARDR